MGSLPDRDATVAEQAFELIAQNKPEAAALLLHQRMAPRLNHYFVTRGVPLADAEELVSDVWIRLLQSCYDGRAKPVVWLWTVVHSVHIDWARARQAQSRGGVGAERREIHVDEETMEVLANTVAASTPPAWLKLCIERAAHAMEQEDPNRAHVLWLWYRGHSASDIAVMFGAEPPPSLKQETAARNRVLEATRKAKQFFEHCRD